MTQFELGTWKVEAGTRSHRMIGAAMLATGERVEVPCIVVNGAQDGPVFVLSGGTHGQELVGVGAVIELCRSLDASLLSGTVIGLPMMNPLAIQASCYGSPQDGVNMASSIYWPGNPKGTITERLGAIIGTVLQRADFYIDVHGNLEPAAPISMLFLEQSRDAATTRKTLELADAFGVTPVDMSSPKAHPALLGPVDGYPAASQLARGVPSLMIELTASRRMADAPRGARGIRNALRAAGMLEGPHERQGLERLPGLYRYYGVLQTEAAGLLWPRNEPGTPLAEDDVVMDVTNAFGEIVGDVRSPVNGFSWGYIGSLQGMASHAVAEGAMVGFAAERVAEHEGQ